MLDPKDWEAFRALAHRALDAAFDRLANVREAPVWQTVPADVRARFFTPLPERPTPLALVYEEFAQAIAPYPTGNIHPRFFGWVHGSGTATGALAELLAATMNSNLGGRDHGAIYVERQVISWARELFGFPTTASGVLTVGTSQANLIAVLVARARALGSEVRTHGVGEQKLTAYASEAAHSSLARAFDIAGLGSATLRLLPVNAKHELEVTTLEAAIAADQAQGRRPFMLIGMAGTVDVGAIDPLHDLADAARRHGLWFHVDGAFGATAILAPSLAPMLRGIERADSLAFDFHKWLHAPYDAGCVLVRDGKLHQETFATHPAYLKRGRRGLSAGEPWFTDFTTDLSRGFRALKVWFTLKEHGAHQLGRAIEMNLRQARLLAGLIEADDAFELLAPVQLAVVCFRHLAPGTEEGVNQFNEELVIRLQESGIAVTSSTTLNGRTAIRVNITNHRTQDDDMRILFQALKELATQIAIE